MALNIDEELQGLSPQERAQREKDWLELIETELTVFEKLNPEGISEVISKLNPEVLLAGLKPDKIAALTPEQRQRLIELLTQTSNETLETN